MGSEMTERERRNRLTSDLEMLGRIGDPTRGPLARYYLPARPPGQSLARPSAPLALWRRALGVVVAQVHRLRMPKPETAWSLLNERRPAKRLS